MLHAMYLLRTAELAKTLEAGCAGTVIRKSQETRGRIFLDSGWEKFVTLGTDGVRYE